MSSIPLVPLPLAALPDDAPIIVLDPEFEARWAKWVKSGQTHEGVFQRNLAMLGGALAVVAAVAYALTR